MRNGPEADSTEYADAWADMKVGVDTKAPLSEFYGQEVIDALTAGTDSLSRWAIPQGQGDQLPTRVFEDGVEEAGSAGNVDGRPLVILSIRKQSGTNSVAVVNGKKKTTAAARIAPTTRCSCTVWTAALM